MQAQKTVRAIPGTVPGELAINKWYNDGYHTYYAGGNRGDCRHPLDSQAYGCWHGGYSQAEAEDIE